MDTVAIAGNVEKMARKTLSVSLAKLRFGDFGSIIVAV
jgi:hypothetical protein